MKNLIEFINETHVGYAPDDADDLKRERDNYERELKDSQKKQKELEKDIAKTEKQFADADEETNAKLSSLHQKMILHTKFYIAREKAEQAYAQLMIDTIDELLKEAK